MVTHKIKAYLAHCNNCCIISLIIIPSLITEKVTNVLKYKRWTSRILSKYKWNTVGISIVKCSRSAMTTMFWNFKIRNITIHIVCIWSSEDKISYFIHHKMLSLSLPQIPLKECVSLFYFTKSPWKEWVALFKTTQSPWKNMCSPNPSEQMCLFSRPPHPHQRIYYLLHSSSFVQHIIHANNGTSETLCRQVCEQCIASQHWRIFAIFLILHCSKW